MVTLLGCGVEPTWRRFDCGHWRQRIERFDVSDLLRKSPARSSGDGSGNLQSRQWMEPKEQRKVDDSSLPCAPQQALDDGRRRVTTTRSRPA
jgi:3-oxoacyl-[acyl-carrier-protein] synthase II